MGRSVVLATLTACRRHRLKLGLQPAIRAEMSAIHFAAYVLTMIGFVAVPLPGLQISRSSLVTDLGRDHAPATLVFAVHDRQ
jgi:hypothetical protein